MINYNIGIMFIICIAHYVCLCQHVIIFLCAIMLLYIMIVFIFIGLISVLVYCHAFKSCKHLCSC